MQPKIIKPKALTTSVMELSERWSSFLGIVEGVARLPC
jgi:hypothetical protein